MTSEAQDKQQQEEKDDDIEVVTDEDLAQRQQNKDDDHDDDEHDQDDDQDDDEKRVKDDRLKAGDDTLGKEETEEEILERRRQERRDRKRRREEAIRRDKLELSFLRKRNEDLERRVSSIETTTSQQTVAQLISELEKSRRQVQLAEDVLAKAIKAGNGEDATKALRLRDAAQERVFQLEQAERQIRQQDQGRRQESLQLDAELVAHAKKFMRDHSWYDPQGGDEDSAIVLALDAALTREGLDPNSEEYWSELRRRVKKRLPERFDDHNDHNGHRGERRQRGGPQMGSGRSTASPSKREVYISKERKEAMIEAGVWDDPVLRKRYIKRYMEYDREHKQHK